MFIFIIYERESEKEIVCSLTRCILQGFLFPFSLVCPMLLQEASKLYIKSLAILLDPFGITFVFHGLPIEK